MSVGRTQCARCGHERAEHRAKRASAPQRCTASIRTNGRLTCGLGDKARVEACKCPEFQEPKQ